MIKSHSQFMSLCFCLLFVFFSIYFFVFFLKGQLACELTVRNVSFTHSSVQLVIDGEDIIMEISYIIKK